MGLITESFGNLGDFLVGEYRKSPNPAASATLLLSHLIRPLMPAGVRAGTGTVIDVRERQVGPIDVLASLDSFPAFGEGPSSIYVSDGVLFAIQARNWADHDLTQFGALAQQLKSLERQRQPQISCLAISYEPLPLNELHSFMEGPAGKAIDGILCLGHHGVLRNSSGLYGDPAKIPFVSERPGPEALKAFAFYLMHLAQAATGRGFGLAPYQHL